MKTNVIRRSNTRSNDFNEIKFEGLKTNVLCQQQSIEVRRVITRATNFLTKKLIILT